MHARVLLNFYDDIDSLEIDSDDLTVLSVQTQGDVADVQSIPDMKAVAVLLNSPFAVNSVTYDIQYVDNEWCCTRTVIVFDGYTAQLCTYAATPENAYELNTVIFAKLQQKYNPQSEAI